MELEACGTGIGNTSRPTEDHRVSGCAEVGCNLLDPLEGCIAGPRPTHGEVRAGSGHAKLIYAPEACFNGRVDSLHRGKFADGAANGSLSARPIVTKNVDNECVLQFAYFI